MAVTQTRLLWRPGVRGVFQINPVPNKIETDVMGGKASDNEASFSPQKNPGFLSICRMKFYTHDDYDKKFKMITVDDSLLEKANVANLQEKTMMTNVVANVQE
ncbi:hypothetical protein Tco_1535993 [Tanacetum coccineum]